MAADRIPASRWVLASSLVVIGMVLWASMLKGGSYDASTDNPHAYMRRDVVFSTMPRPASMSSFPGPAPVPTNPPSNHSTAQPPTVDLRRAKATPSVSPTPTPTPTSTTNATASIEIECNITGLAELEDWVPLCNATNLNETAMGLRNRLVKQCMYTNEDNEISVGECNEVNYTRVCVDPCTLEVKSIDGRCFGVADGDPQEMEQRLSLVECDSEYQGRWLFGGLDGERLGNNMTSFCADVEHQHHNGPVITWKCKPRDGYEPQNQAWLWY
eukprot:comp22299_c0_seq1/m.33094 comp22299_c0_seq1/g.33094  ORF comp22299_c0_seq1/g.33094 comp22299_c0_seq1/m.33094 type:complete len:271 (-) comp22299_c0_seq1:107-919(-)